MHATSSWPVEKAALLHAVMGLLLSYSSLPIISSTILIFIGVHDALQGRKRIRLCALYAVRSRASKCSLQPLLDTHCCLFSIAASKTETGNEQTSIGALGHRLSLRKLAYTFAPLERTSNSNDAYLISVV